MAEKKQRGKTNPKGKSVNAKMPYSGSITVVTKVKRGLFTVETTTLNFTGGVLSGTSADASFTIDTFYV